MLFSMLFSMENPSNKSNVQTYIQYNTVSKYFDRDKGFVDVKCV